MGDRGLHHNSFQTRLVCGENRGDSSDSGTETAATRGQTLTVRGETCASTVAGRYLGVWHNVRMPHPCNLPSYHDGKCNGTPNILTCLAALNRCPFCRGTTVTPGGIRWDCLTAPCRSSWHRQHGSSLEPVGQRP